VQNSLCVQVLRSPILAALLHGAPAAGLSQTLRCGTRNGITELSQTAPPIFGRAAIRLGIGPHRPATCCSNRPIFSNLKLYDRVDDNIQRIYVRFLVRGSREYSKFSIITLFDSITAVSYVRTTFISERKSRFLTILFVSNLRNSCGFDQVSVRFSVVTLVQEKT